jgi:1,4-dihydroxy-2-naphthoate octaprenyltransferase
MATRAENSKHCLGRLSPADVVRALRLPFLTASVLPFLLGAVLAGGPRSIPGLVLGLATVALTHLAGNVVNDYADDLTGADRADREHYGFFGGSKLIQQGLVPAKAYRAAGLAFTAGGAAAAFGLAGVHDSAWPIAGWAIAVTLAWAYTHAPMRLVYRGLGEATVVLLFGPACVVAGAFAASGTMPETPVWVVSMVPGLMTAGILVANEVPDARVDARAGKRTLVGLLGRNHGWLAYGLLVAAAMALLAGVVTAGWLGGRSLLGLVALIPAVGAAVVLRRPHDSKSDYKTSARLVILAQTLATLGAATGAAP